MVAKKKKLVNIIIVFAVIILAFFIAFEVYVQDYYHALDVVVSSEADDTVQIIQIKEGYLLDGPGENMAVIFYPGAKVETEAYIPLMKKIAQQGMDAFLIDMPYRLAFFGLNKADSIMEAYSYEGYVLSGHSLGGAMVASYAAGLSDKPKEHKNISGVVLLAAYATKSLEGLNCPVSVVYGSNDTVVSREKIAEGRSLCGSGYEEVVLEGGNHAMFGNYGFQEGDTLGDITTQEQQNQTVGIFRRYMR